jgi:hypothetical protein
MPKDNEQKNATLDGEITCIKVTKETRAKLAGHGKKGESYETVINSLLESVSNKTEEEIDS